jgi:hypothetical protein
LIETTQPYRRFGGIGLLRKTALPPRFNILYYHIARYPNVAAFTPIIACLFASGNTNFKKEQ